ncbi:hypothetical protein NsoK4_01185 [Nitrosopumilus sp. K4]|uniref:hypothetical protein n=1 Tax=Nitrosopumilus sp. K4 TaxID=2795383 RepID=UPI001BA84DBE|nr:hypothetical protein [Nitrosopumilus sp. K4]QUC64925.1 hypothetical protein NsoK4_01185 [Nitrosopumilus sp. K4]
MASKKGIIVTVIILAAITGGSFIFWTIPQETESTFVVSDYGNYLDGVKKIHEVLQESIDTEFQNMRDGNITPDEYISITDVTTSQVTAKISEFVTSKPSEPWQESYISYMDALKKFNSYIVETKVYANMIKDGSSQEEMSEVLKKIETLKAESIEMIKTSDSQRP